MKKNWLYTGLIVITILALACDKDKNSPGYTYYPDMTYSRAFETNSENPNFKDDQTMRTPAEGTIPRGYSTFPYEKNDKDMIRAGKELKNPIEYTDVNKGRGEIVYKRYCLQCHGEKGDGKGHLYTSGLFLVPPASLINEKMLKKPDGEIFHQVTLGWGIMGEYGLIVRPEDRWKTIIYIREELQKNQN